MTLTDGEHMLLCCVMTAAAVHKWHLTDGEHMLLCCVMTAAAVHKWHWLIMTLTDGEHMLLCCVMTVAAVHKWHWLRVNMCCYVVWWQLLCLLLLVCSTLFSASLASLLIPGMYLCLNRHFLLLNLLPPEKWLVIYVVCWHLSVCLYVCLFVCNMITFGKPWRGKFVYFLACRYIFRGYWSGSCVKVITSMSASQQQKSAKFPIFAV